MSVFKQTEIHISDVKAFRSCRRKWNWSSRIRENLEPISPYVPFFTGKAVHAALEFLYRDESTFEDTLEEYFEKEMDNLNQLGELWPIEKAQFEEQVDLISIMLHHYQLWQASDKTNYSDSNLEFVDMEVGFEVPLFDDVTYGGRFDGIVRRKDTGDLWIFESKTARSVSQLIDSLALDEQSTMYLWAAKQLYPDENVAGVLYNIMRKKAPQPPAVLQNGTFSKAKIDSTTWYYEYCVRQRFPDFSDETVWDQYGDALNKLENTKYFMRFPLHKTQAQIDVVLTELIQTAIEMLNPSVPIYASPGWANCNFCRFKGPCLAYASGADYRPLLEAEYQLRTSATSMREGDTDE